MIELVPIPADHVVGVRIDGRIEEPDIARVIAELEDRLERHAKLSVLVELASLEGISFDALRADLEFALQHFRDFERKAVISDKRWAERLTKLTNPLFPSIDARHFRPEERDAAIAWAIGG